MGEWEIKIEGGPSGHGCDRRAVEGETLTNCGRSECPDCLIVETLANLQRRGVAVKSARITHGPGGPDAVVDEYVPGHVKGTVIGTRKQNDFRPKAKPPAAAEPAHTEPDTDVSKSA